MLLHIVFFRLKFVKGSSEAIAFLNAMQRLAALPMVGRFQTLRSIRPDREFDFGVSMEFEDQAAFDAYLTHSEHTAFGRDHWREFVENHVEHNYFVVN